MKIRVLLPIVVDIFNEEVKQEFRNYFPETTEIEVCHLDYGPASVEGEYDEALCVPNMLEDGCHRTMEFWHFQHVYACRAFMR